MKELLACHSVKELFAYIYKCVRSNHVMKFWNCFKSSPIELDKAHYRRYKKTETRCVRDEQGLDT